MKSLRSFLRKIKNMLFQKRTIISFAALLTAFLIYKQKSVSPKPIKLSYFLLSLTKNQIQEVMVQGSDLFFANENSWFKTDISMLTKDMLFKILREKPNLVFSSQSKGKGMEGLLMSLIMFGSMFLVGMQLMGGIDSSIMSKKDFGNGMKSRVSFNDIYGLNYAKKDLKELIDFLKDPLKYERIGARLRRGVLIYGPPGTGKTLLAKATAGESDSSFLYCTASEFVEIYVGMGQKRVRELFEQARRNAPCIIFIDEIDGIGMRRERNFGGEKGVDMERSTTLNQLLAEMDGFRENDKIIVVAATNRILCLDDALLRSGRFDTKIRVELPNEEERKGILLLHLKKKKQKVSEKTINIISESSKSYSGADIENIVNESAYMAIQENRGEIGDEDLLNSWDKIRSQREARQYN